MTSTAELLLEAQLQQAGIPFEREYRFAPPRRWRADFLVQPGDILIEVDGGTWLPKGRHTTGLGFEKDSEKLNVAAELGYVVLRYTPKSINDGSALEQIRRILSKKEAA